MDFSHFVPPPWITSRHLHSDAHHDMMFAAMDEADQLYLPYSWLLCDGQVIEMNAV